MRIEVTYSNESKVYEIPESTLLKSEYFTNMLRSGFRESSGTIRLNLTQFQPANFEAYIVYLDTGVIVPDIYPIAEYYAEPRLPEIENQLRDQLYQILLHPKLGKISNTDMVDLARKASGWAEYPFIEVLNNEMIRSPYWNTLIPHVRDILTILDQKDRSIVLCFRSPSSLVLPPCSSHPPTLNIPVSRNAVDLRGHTYYCPDEYPYLNLLRSGKICCSSINQNLGVLRTEIPTQPTIPFIDTLGNVHPIPVNVAYGRDYLLIYMD